MPLIDPGRTLDDCAIAADQPVAAKLDAMGGNWRIAVYTHRHLIHLRYEHEADAREAWPRIVEAIANNGKAQQ